MGRQTGRQKQIVCVRQTDCFDPAIYSWLAHMGELFFKAGGLSALFVLRLLLRLLSHTINKQLLSVVYKLYAMSSVGLHEGRSAF